MVQPQTRVRLCENVPLTTKYDHQLTFTNETEQNTYFMGKVAHTFDNFTYQRKDVTIRVDKLVDNIRNCNYLMFQNDHYTNKWFYAFITDMEYINPNTTAIHFQIDVWQTWQFDLNILPSFVEREHCDRWNSDGSPVVNTIDEGIDYGTDYDVMKVDEWQPYGSWYFMVVVAKETLSSAHVDVPDGIYASRNGLPQPLCYYVHPFYLDGVSPDVTFDGSSNGIDNVTDVLRNIFTQEDAVNNIVSMYVSDYIGYEPTNNGGTLDFDGDHFIPVTIADGVNPNVATIQAKEMPPYNPISQDMGSKYSNFASVEESKLMMYPYCVLTLTDFKGNQIDFKPEYIDGDNVVIRAKGSMGLSNKVAYQLVDYNTSNVTAQEMNTIAIENAVINNDPQDIPIINDYLASYLQGNRNSLQTQKQSAYFNGVMGGGNTIMGAVGGAMVGGVPGAVAGGAIGLTQSIGSTYFQVKQLESQIRDISNVPPQLTSMGSNTYFDYGNGYKGIYLVKKQIKPEYRKKLTDYFKMYGYKIHEVKTPNLKTRNHFNFIRTIGANITGNIPQNDLTTLKEIFDSGITFWHGDFVGDYSLSNNEV